MKIEFLTYIDFADFFQVGLLIIFKKVNDPDKILTGARYDVSTRRPSYVV